MLPKLFYIYLRWQKIQMKIDHLKQMYCVWS